MTNPLDLDVPAGVPWIDFTREFDAPVAAVFDAHRDPAKVVRWLGPRGYEMVAERWDFVSGGGYRYVHRDPDGNEYWFRGCFHTVRENEFALQTFEFEGMPDDFPPKRMAADLTASDRADDAVVRRQLAAAIDRALADLAPPFRAAPARHLNLQSHARNGPVGGERQSPHRVGAGDRDI